jgi:hypothetical protein
MPVNHQINHELQLIITTVTGKAVDEELIKAMEKYQRDIRSKSEYIIYNEVLDFSESTKIKLTNGGIKTIAKIASTNDHAAVKTKLALIVKSPFVFGLARMYQIYRGLNPKANKEVRIFNRNHDAFEWIEHN